MSKINLGIFRPPGPLIKGIKLGVYDADNNFYGYKTDTFWTLNKHRWKEHSPTNNKHLITNFIDMLNYSEQKIEESDGVIGIFKFIGNNFLKSTEQMRETKVIYIKIFDLKNNQHINTIKIYKNKKNQWTWKEQEDLV